MTEEIKNPTLAQYEAAEMEIVLVDSMDIICTSGGGAEQDGDGFDDGEWL